MLICPACRCDAIRGATCACGEDSQVKVQGDGAVVGLYGEHGIACQLGCDSVADLGFRRYRRVIGWVVFDHIETLAGYYCADCRQKLFLRYQGRTLLLGWWGILSALYRNPYAIGVNLRALVGPPRVASRFGAMALYKFDASETLASGTVPDTWYCEACESYLVGFREAWDHAARAHGDLRRGDAMAALRQISKSTTLEPASSQRRLAYGIYGSSSEGDERVHGVLSDDHGAATPASIFRSSTQRLRGEDEKDGSCPPANIPRKSAHRSYGPSGSPPL